MGLALLARAPVATIPPIDTQHFEAKVHDHAGNKGGQYHDGRMADAITHQSVGAANDHGIHQGKHKAHDKGFGRKFGYAIHPIR